MSAAELITKAERYGAHLGIEDGRVYVDPPAAIPRDLYRELKSHAGELLELLTACQMDPLPPEGDPRRAVFEIIDEVWEAGGRLLVTGDRVRPVPRDAAVPSPRVDAECQAAAMNGARRPLLPSPGEPLMTEVLPCGAGRKLVDDDEVEVDIVTKNISPTRFHRLDLLA